jgi:hypothetical protein
LAKPKPNFDFQSYFDFEKEVQSDSAIQPKQQKVLTVETKNDKKTKTRQEKFYDHSKYHDAPKACDIPMDMFD